MACARDVFKGIRFIATEYGGSAGCAVRVAVVWTWREMERVRRESVHFARICVGNEGLVVMQVNLFLERECDD